MLCSALAVLTLCSPAVCQNWWKQGTTRIFVWALPESSCGMFSTWLMPSLDLYYCKMPSSNRLLVLSGAICTVLDLFGFFVRAAKSKFPSEKPMPIIYNKALQSPARQHGSASSTDSQPFAWVRDLFPRRSSSNQPSQDLSHWHVGQV